MEAFRVLPPLDQAVVGGGRDQESHRREHEAEGAEVEVLGGARQALEAGFKGGPVLKAQQHLGADDEQAALIERVLDFVLEGCHAP